MDNLNLVASSKLYKTLGLLSRDEFRRLGDFVKSPYFNKSKKIRQVYSFINSKSFSPASSTIRELSDFLYGDGSFNENRIWLVLSDFIKLVEKFAACDSYKNDNILNSFRVIRFYRERGDQKSAMKLLNQTLQALIKDVSKDEVYYYLLSNLHIEEYLTGVGERLDSSFAGIVESGVMNDSDKYFVVISLKSYIHIIRNNPSLGLKGLLKFPFGKQVLDYAGRNLAKFAVEDFLIYCHYLVLMQYAEPDNEHYFFDLKKFVFRNSQKLDPRYIMSFCLHLHNYCTSRLNEGVLKFRKEAFEIDKMLEKNNSLFGSRYLQYIDHVHFVNICYTAIIAGELKWAETFIKKHKDSIAPHFRESTYSLVAAELLFEREKFTRSLETLNHIKLSDSLFYLYAQVLRMKIFYELNEPEPLLSIIDSLGHYLKRNKKIPEAHIVLYKKSLMAIQQLTKLKFRNRDIDLKGLIKKLDTDFTIPHNEWLMEKAKELASK